MKREESGQNVFIVTTAAGWEGEARSELLRLIEGAECYPLFLKGNLVLRAPGRRCDALKVLRDAETRCVSRIIPVDAEIAVPKSRESLAALAEAVASLGGLAPDDTFAVRCERRGDHEFASRDVEVAVGRRLAMATGATVSLDAPGKVAVVQIYQSRAFVGIVEAHELIRKPLSKVRKYAPGTRPLNRSELKLREIVRRFGLEIEPGMHALDLGAAPGGWTRVLAEQGARVLAVDPADLHPDVSALANVAHFRGHAEELAPDPAGDAFDILTNDMNADPDASARAMCLVAPLLRPGAAAVMTIKFVSRKRRQHVADATRVLAEAFEDIRVGRVPHNAKEATAVMRRKA